MKKPLIAVSIAAVLIGFGGYAAYANGKEKEQIQQEQIQKQVDTIQDLQSNVDKLYKDNKKEFLSENITKENMDLVQEKLKKQEKIDFTPENKKKFQQINKDVEHAKSMFGLQSSVKSLLDDKGALNEDAKIDVAEKQAEELKKVKVLFVDVQQKIIDEAKRQQKEIEDATTAIHNLFTTPEKTEVKGDVTREIYNEAAKLIENIKQEKKKQELSASLSQIDQVLKDREEAASKKKQEEEKQKATEIEKEQVQKQTTNSQEGNQSNEAAPSSNNATASSKSATSSNATAPSKSTQSSSTTAPSKSTQSSSTTTPGKSTQSNNTTTPNKSTQSNNATTPNKAPSSNNATTPNKPKPSNNTPASSKPNKPVTGNQNSNTTTNNSNSQPSSKPSGTNSNNSKPTNTDKGQGQEDECFNTTHGGTGCIKWD